MAKKTKRIPKTIGGVKLPKELRRAGEKIIDHAITTANSPQGKAMIATGLSMAAAAAMKAAEKPSPANDARTDEARRPDASGIDGDAIGQAVEQVLGRLFGKRV
jgi:hypothetical protein